MKQSIYYEYICRAIKANDAQMVKLLKIVNNLRMGTGSLHTDIYTVMTCRWQKTMC